jgi:hypothetical protein
MPVSDRIEPASANPTLCPVLRRLSEGSGSPAQPLLQRLMNRL